MVEDLKSSNSIFDLHATLRLLLTHLRHIFLIHALNCFAIPHHNSHHLWNNEYLYHQTYHFWTYQYKKYHLRITFFLFLLCCYFQNYLHRDYLLVKRNTSLRLKSDHHQNYLRTNCLQNLIYLFQFFFLSQNHLYKPQSLFKRFLNPNRHNNRLTSFLYKNHHLFYYSNYLGLVVYHLWIHLDILSHLKMSICLFHEITHL